MTPQGSGKKTTHVWDRWQRATDFVFYALLLVGLASALFDGPTEGAYSWAYAVAACGLSAFLGLWYWLIVVGRGEELEGNLRWALAYFAVAVPLFAASISVHPGFMSLAFVFYWQNFSFLQRARWSVPGAALLTVLLIWGGSGARAVARIAQDPAFLSVFVIALVTSGVLATFIGSIISQSSKRQGLIEELERTRRELAVQERRAGVLEERGRLAREIHDTLAQGFISIVAHLEASEAALPSGSETSRRHLDLAREMARDNLVEARHLVAALRPEILAGSPLPEALRRLTDRFSHETNVTTTLTVTGGQRDLPPGHQVALLRVAQEALSNARKHAAATSVTITLSYMDDLVALDVQDDGKGFDKDRVSGDVGGGFGLRAMRERVEGLGGALTVETESGEGATLVVELPVKAPGCEDQVSENAKADAR